MDVGELVVVEDEVVQLGHAAEGVVGDAAQSVAIQVEGSQVLQVFESVRRDGADGVPREGEVHQLGHVGEVFALDAGYEVVPKTHLHRVPVNVRGHEEKPLFVAQSRQVGVEHLADAAFGADLDFVGLRSHAEDYQVNQERLHLVLQSG